MEKNIKSIFIPLGTRCSAATILKDHFKVREFSLPFDWIDIPIKNIVQFIERFSSSEEYLINYVTDYIIASQGQRHPDGTYFPHDFVSSHFSTETDMMRYTIEKFQRRFLRLREVFKSTDSRKIFFTVCSQVQSEESEREYTYLTYTIKHKLSSAPVFIAVNLYDYDFNTELGDPAFFNFHVPISKPLKEMTGADWAAWELDIVEKISLSPAKKYFLK